MVRRLLATAAFFAGLSCGENSGPGSLIAHGSSLAAQLDTLDAALGSPQLKSLGSLALPLLSVGVTFSTMDSTMLGRTLEWDPIWRRLDFTTRAGAPSNAIRLMLYKNDATGVPVVPKEEVGYAYLVPMNLHTGGKPDSVSLRIAVFNNATPTAGSVAEIMAWRRPSDVSCGQCASFSASAGPVSIGNRTIYLDVPFQIPVDGDGQYSATSSGGGFNFNHTATLPGPSSTAATANLGFRFGSDSIVATSGPLHPNSGRLIGPLNVTINGAPFATVTRAANGTTATRPGGQGIGGTDLRVLEGLFAVPADIAYYIEWPMFVVFYCGC
ncbi:MAG: hypothetical protein DMD54_15040 [Gemmatimonadetes bacterium]|nr:MAG: hypothetical protein DMD54_15040 [Gemmatimonadota bacterium]